MTSARHMPRAAACFRALGMTVVPAPADRVIRSGPLRVRDWLPDAVALEGSLGAIHEYAGLLAYRLFHGVRWAGG